jgi:hypothetical protein
VRQERVETGDVAPHHVRGEPLPRIDGVSRENEAPESLAGGSEAGADSHPDVPGGAGQEDHEPTSILRDRR